jgi:hypothetical protein
MPVKITKKPEFNIIILEHIGKIPDSEFLSFYKSFFESSNFNPSSNLLVNLVKTDSTIRSSEAVYQLANYFRQKYKDTDTHPKIAVIAPKDVSFGLARTYEAFTDSIPGEFVVFRDETAAMAWMGIPDNYEKNPINP